MGKWVDILQQIKKLESNSGRANEFVSAFTLGVSWDDYQNTMAELEKVSKEDILEGYIGQEKMFYVIVK